MMKGDSEMSITVEIEGHFERNLIKDEKSGFAIFYITSYSPEAKQYANSYGCITCKGYLPPFKRLEYIVITGTVEKDSYGEFIKVEKAVEACKNEMATVRYLSSSVFGIPYDKAKALVAEAGSDIYEFAAKPDAAKIVAKITGLSARKSTLVVDTIMNTTHWRELFDYGFDKGLSYATIQRLIQDYGGRAKKVLCDNPYEIGLKYGATFECCDAIAFDNGGSPMNRNRIKAVAKIALRADETRGHVFSYEEELFNAIKKKLMKKCSVPIPSAIISNSISGDKDICIERAEHNRIYLADNKFAEQNTARQIKRLINNGVDLPYSDELIAYAEKICKVTLADEQRQSFELLKRTGMAILTGGPGTGKTTVIKGILSAYKKMCPNAIIKLCAPSGRAAQRMAESTGMEATTIHRLLEYKPFSGGNASYKTADDPIEADLIVIDEGSMVDLKLASMLLSATKTGALVLLVGDINQLQSVGAGDFLNDCIKCNVIPVVQLRKVYRQAADSPIVSNAYAINNGRCELIENNNFEVLKCNSEMFSTHIGSLVRNCYRPDDPFYVQVLCPTHKGDGGVSLLNKVLQEQLNPSGSSDGKKLLYGGTEYRIHDKIIMLKNNPDMGYFNGDIGIVKKISDNEMTVEIQKKDIVLSREQFDDIKLAYAMSIHKSQGSEFPITIVSLPTCNMLQRNLLYTGITRGKETVIIVEENGNIEKSVMKCDVGKRNSRLAERIIKEI